MGSWQLPREDRAGPPKQAYRGPPMTLANMRANGVRSLSVSCGLCGHEALLNVDAFGGAMPIPAFGPRMICSSCGIVGADARPNWTERYGGTALPAGSDGRRPVPGLAIDDGAAAAATTVGELVALVERTTPDGPP
jgi:hypothetical protein